MPSVNSDLLIKLKATYEGSTLKQLTTDLRDLKQNTDLTTKSTSDYATKVNYLTEQINKQTTAFKNASSEQKQSNSAMLNTAKNIGVIAIATIEATKAIMEFAKSMKEMVMKGAEYGVLKDNFDKLAGSTEKANEQLQLMRKASGGELNNKDLIEYNAKMTLLGFSVADTSKLLFLVHERSEQIGISFDKGEKLLQTFILTGRGRGLQQLGINIADVNKEMEKLTLATGKTKDEMSEEEIQAIRMNAVLNVSKIKMEDLEKSTLSTAGKINSFQSATENAKLEIGNFIANGLVNMIESFGLTGSAATTAGGYVSSFGSLLMGLIPTIAALKIAFPDLGSAIIKSMSGVGMTVALELGLIVAAVMAVMYLINEVNKQADKQKKWKEEHKNEEKQLQNEFYNKPTLKEQSNTVWNSADSEFDPVTGKRISGNTTKGTVISATLDDARELDKITNDIDKKIKNITDPKNNIKGGKSNNKDLQEEKVVLDEIQQLKEDIKLLDAKRLEDIKNYGKESGIVLDDTNKLLVANDKLNYLLTGQKKDYNAMAEAMAKMLADMQEAARITKEQNKPKPTPEGRNNPSQGGGAKATTKELFDAFGESVGKIGDIFKGIASTLGLAADSFVGKLISGFDTVVSLIQTVLATIQAYQTASSFIKMLIPFFADGGLVSGAGTGRSDSIMARISNGEFVMNAKSTAAYLPMLQAMNGNGGVRNATRYADGGMVNRNVNNNSVYITANQDGITFLKNNFPKYLNDKRYTRIA